MPDHPFTTDEIYAALRLMGVSEDEAPDAAADAVTPTAPQDTSEPELPPGALKFYNAPSVQFMGDFLAALSLVSPSVEKKVREYRDSLRTDPTEDQEWEKRRDELRRTLRRKGR